MQSPRTASNGEHRGVTRTDERKNRLSQAVGLHKSGILQVSAKDGISDVDDDCLRRLGILSKV